MLLLPQRLDTGLVGVWGNIYKGGTMPLGKNVRYAVKKTSKGPVRLAFSGKKVIEAKNMKTGKVHTPAEFKADAKKAKRK